jgi:hypothetical protein
MRASAGRYRTVTRAGGASPERHRIETPRRRRPPEAAGFAGVPSVVCAVQKAGREMRAPARSGASEEEKR